MGNILRTCVAAATLLTAFMPLLPAKAAALIFPLGFIALLLAAASAVLAFTRKKFWRIVHGISFAVCIPFLTAYIPIVKGEITGGGQTLRIVSWNTANFMTNRDTMLHASAYISDQHPDIVCLQERPHDVKVAWNDITTAFSHLPHAARNSHEDEVLNLAILSRYPILRSGERTFEGTYNKYMWADIAAGKDTLRVFCIHLQTNHVTGWKDLTNNASKRNAQADKLAADIDASPYPVVACGDFNDTPSGYPARLLRRRLTDLSRQWPLHGTFKPFGSMLKIDYMMHSLKTAPLSYSLIATPWSDHKMQVGEIHSQ